MKKKTMAMLIALVLVLVCAVGGTLAWLTDKTETVKNTFTVGNIDIDLTEDPNADTDGNGENDAWKATMVPGVVLDKNPTITVTEDSEPCWVFVKVTKTGTATLDGDELTFDDFMDYNMASGWTPLGDGVFYYDPIISDGATLDVISYDGTVDKIKVKDDVTKEMLDALGTTDLTLEFTAYAVQAFNNGTEMTAAQAWALVPAEDK